MAEVARLTVFTRRVNQWAMFQDVLGEPSIRYGKLLLVNRPLQNREKWPEFELFAHGETQPRRPGSCPLGVCARAACDWAPDALALAIARVAASRPRCKSSEY